MYRSALVAIALLAPSLGACQRSGDSSDEDKCPEWVLGEVVDTEGCATLAKLPGPWGDDLWIVRVHGSPREMGFQYGRLMGPLMKEMWLTYMDALNEEAGFSDSGTLSSIIGELLDVAWDWFEPNVSNRFYHELEGISAGMEAAGISDPELLLIPTRMISLVELAMSSQLSVDDLGSLGDFLNNGMSRNLRDYYRDKSGTGIKEDALDSRVRNLIEKIEELNPKILLLPFKCSYYAAWGNRTDHGGLYATRNMDFTSDTGMGRYASVAVFVPDDGVPYASISWVGANVGALAGMSREGLTISAVGASSPFERVNTQPALLKAREVLERSYSLDDALAYMDNTVGDGITRAPTIGYNALVTWGDPRGDGANAGALVLENNGLSSGAFLHHSDCSVDTMLFRFDRQGAISTLTPQSHPELVNREEDAVEIDAEGNPKLFAHDGTDFILNESGQFIEDPDGQPLRTGYPLPCALYRGNEALAFGVRKHQYACNGPAREDNRLMVNCGSYQNRYTPMREMTEAWEAGESWSWKGKELIQSNNGTTKPITMDGAEAVSRVAAMRENTWDVVYDATRLVMRLSYESGSGENWVAASEQPSFLEIRLQDLFLTD